MFREHESETGSQESALIMEQVDEMLRSATELEYIDESEAIRISESGADAVQELRVSGQQESLNELLEECETSLPFEY